MRPMQSGPGMRATKLPNAAGGRAQTSSSIATPSSATRASPGLAGVVFGSAKKRYFGAVRAARKNRPPVSVSW